ncbi:MAG: hypothetical protein J6575_05860 [Bifidobacterium sp.]|nr:hypothetical protein [Bifidobacterium sp.]
MNDSEIFERFGITAEQMDEWANEAENDEWAGGSDLSIRLRPITPEIQDAIDRVWACWDAQDTKKQIAESVRL